MAGRNVDSWEITACRTTNVAPRASPPLSLVSP